MKTKLLTRCCQQDITVLPPDPGLGPEPYSFGDLSFVSWIHVARIQGRAYEELYSPAALKQSDEVRRSRVKAMADEVMEVMQRSEGMNVSILLPGFPALTYGRRNPLLPHAFLSHTSLPKRTLRPLDSWTLETGCQPPRMGHYPRYRHVPTHAHDGQSIKSVGVDTALSCNPFSAWLPLDFHTRMRRCGTLSSREA